MTLSFPKYIAENKTILIFILGLLSMVKFRVLGTFSIAELIAMGCLPFVNPLQCWRNRSIRLLLCMMFLWLVGTIISDVINSTPIIKALKGSFNVIFFILSVPFVYWTLKDKVSRILFFWLGMGISAVIMYYVAMFTSENFNDYFHIYADVPLAVSVSGFLYFKGWHWQSYLFAVAFGFIALSMQARHIFLLINIVVPLLILRNWLIDRKSRGCALAKGWRISLIVCTIATSAILTLSIYSFAATNGMMGEWGRAKFERQSQSNISLLSGRRDFLISLYTVALNPVWGYGSYAEDTNNYTETVLQKIESKENVAKLRFHDNLTLMRSHSHILGAWVFSGILGFVFWCYVLVCIVRFIAIGFGYDARLAMFYGLQTAIVLWDIFFSPFGDRIVLDVYLVSVILIIQYQKGRNASGRHKTVFQQR